MRRATGITLVLMGGGLAVGLATCGGGRASAAECQEARKQNRPDAERICSSGGYGGQHGSHSDRGGFGHTGAAHASFGG